MVGNIVDEIRTCDSKVNRQETGLQSIPRTIENIIVPTTNCCSIDYELIIFEKRMYKVDFRYSPATIDFSFCNTFSRTSQEKKELYSMIHEWNRRVSISTLCTIWEKQRPSKLLSENILFLLYNCECLSTHQADLDILISSYLPHIVILTGIGSLIGNLPLLPNYYWLSQKGTNSFGGVAILIHHSIKCTIVYTVENFLLAEIDILSSKILVGAVYVPPNKQPPFEHFSRLNGKEFYVFGDFNAKHSLWSCETNNTSGSELKEMDGKDGMYPSEDKLGPISLLPNLGKWFEFERCIHEQIQAWCKDKRIYTDEQSGFTPNRRLKSRIL
ncbi:unnamed protein product [Rotaria magnacalcarata]|nr:unnamed protein product [Rotaria magnacalcarata]